MGNENYGKMIYDRIFSIREKIPSSRWDHGNKLEFAREMLCQLAVAARDGHLSPEQYSYFSEATEMEIVRKVYEESGRVLEEKLSELGLKPVTGMPGGDGAEFISNINGLMKAHRQALDEMVKRYDIPKWEARPDKTAQMLLARRKFWQDYGKK